MADVRQAFLAHTVPPQEDVQELVEIKIPTLKRTVAIRQQKSVQAQIMEVVEEAVPGGTDNEIIARAVMNLAKQKGWY